MQCPSRNSSVGEAALTAKCAVARYGKPILPDCNALVLLTKIVAAVESSAVSCKLLCKYTRGDYDNRTRVMMV